MMVKGNKGKINTIDQKILKKAKILLHDENLMQLETNLLEKLQLAHNNLYQNNPLKGHNTQMAI